MSISKRPSNIHQLAKLIVDLKTGEKGEIDIKKWKNPVAVALGKLGGLKGGEARAKKLSPQRRKEIAQKAAASRWKKKK